MAAIDSRGPASRTCACDRTGYAFPTSPAIHRTSSSWSGKQSTVSTEPVVIAPVVVAKWSALEDRKPAHALVEDVDLVVVRYDDEVSVLYGRCLHRGALMADGY